MKFNELTKENPSIIYGIERVYKGAKDYAETLSEVVDERTSIISIVNLDDIGRNTAERLDVLRYFRVNDINLRIIRIYPFL